MTRICLVWAIFAAISMCVGCGEGETPNEPIVEKSVTPRAPAPVPEEATPREVPAKTPGLTGAELMARQQDMLKAAAEGRSFNVGVMLEEGLDVNLRSEKPGEAALHLAAGNGHLATVEMLIERGADVNLVAKNDRGDVPLHDAADGGYAGVVERLLKAGADVNARTADNGLTPLMLAAAGGHLDTVCLLLKAGADVSQVGVHVTKRISFSGIKGSAIERSVTTSREERTAEEMAKTERHRKVADLLRSWRKGLKKAARYCKMDPDGAPAGADPETSGSKSQSNPPE